MKTATSLSFLENLKSTEISEEQEKQLIKFYELLFEYEKEIDKLRGENNILFIQEEDNEFLAYFSGVYFLPIDKEKFFSFSSDDLIIIGEFLEEALND